MIALWEDADLAPTHAVSVDVADLDMLHEGIGIVATRAAHAAEAQPDVPYFAERAERSRALLSALGKHLAGVRNAEREVDRG